MTVPSESCRTSYVTNGVTVAFPTVWRFLNNAHVRARFTPTGGEAQILTEGVHYSLVGAGLDGGGTLTTMGGSSPLGAGALVIERVVPLTQLVDLRAQGTFSPAVHMTIMDQLAMGVQQLAARIGALEALAGLVSVADFGSQLVSWGLITDAGDVENSFPFDVPVVAPAGKTVAGAIVAKAQGGFGQSMAPVQLQRWSWADDVLTVQHITGLEPGTAYQLVFLILHTEL